MSLVIENVLRDELNRLERMEKAYSHKIKDLPSGILVKKVINGNL